MLPIDTIAVLGGSEAGSACAVLAALAGCAVRLHDPSPQALGRAVETLRREVERAHRDGLLRREERQRILDGVLFTLDLAEAATGADLVVDTQATFVPALFPRLAALVRATTPVAAAGATAPARIAAVLPQPGRVLAVRIAARGTGSRVDVAPGPRTTGHVLDRAHAFAARVNRAARGTMGA